MARSWLPPVGGRAITGVKVDKRTNYDLRGRHEERQSLRLRRQHGAQLAEYQLTTAESTFINDEVVTRDAVYFTDSFQPYIYKLPLGPGGRLPHPSQVEPSR